MRNTASKSGQTDTPFKHSALFELFLTELKDIYWAEKHILKNLSKMIKSAHAEALKMALQDHLERTEEQVGRLEEVFQLIDVRAVGKRCEGIDGLVEEAKEIMDETENDTFTRDAAIISSTQKIEHYEIAAYGTMKTLAGVLELDDQVIDLLQETLDEEKEADQKLTQLAEARINVEARDE